MGADLYIEHPKATEYSNKWQPKLDEAINERDSAMSIHGSETVKSQDNNIWSVKYKSPKVQSLQEKVDDYANKLWGDNPYYFRDSYNVTSIAWRLKLSWWQLYDDLKAYISDGVWSTEGCIKLLNIVEEAEKTWDVNEITIDWLIDNHALAKTQSDVIEWRESYARRLKELKEFIQRAIDLGAGIRMSV